MKNYGLSIILDFDGYIVFVEHFSEHLHTIILGLSYNIIGIVT